MNVNQILKNANLFEVLAQIGISGQELPFIRKFLFDNNLFYGPVDGNNNQVFAEMWMSLLGSSGVGDVGYNIAITIPAGTLSVVFSGQPEHLVSYLNKTLAPKITSLLTKNNGKKLVDEGIGSYTIAPPSEALTFDYMIAE